jgi:acyl-CoA reductase-like NAD-dependent aldehyde dehydrogenase
MDARFREGSSDMLRALDAGLAYVGERERAGFGAGALRRVPAVLPFNLPSQVAARSPAQALVTGNAMVVKPAEQAPSALAPTHRVAEAVRAGQVIVNNCGVAGGVEPALGGYGQDGFGRLKSIDGALTYIQTECVRVAL